jgi:phosphopantothenoylcysteine decarboxylase / phosphopantothenate---cysteine ligase
LSNLVIGELIGGSFQSVQSIPRLLNDSITQSPMLIALGVTGGIGAYKAVEVARGLQKRGHEVVAVMTHGATRFVGPITFEAITRRQVITDQFEAGMNADIEHIALASTIDLLLIAPATANIIGKLANGIADDFLSTLYTATRAPLLLAPAMNTQMFEHEAVRKNLETLAARGARFVEPGEGYLACGWIGKGRLAEPEDIVAAAEAILRPEGPLRGQRLLVTAGPTYEDVDPVRYIGNRSSGRMGYAIAAEAARRGALVTLVTGPTTIEAPAVRELVKVRSAADMHQAVLSRAADMDVIVMAAAVADYAPAERAGQKVAKEGETLTLMLKRTPDILGELGEQRAAKGIGPLLIGFAAETQDVVARASAKRERKHADLIVANDVSRADAGFDVDTNAVTIVGPSGAETLPLQSKSRVAAEILNRVERLLAPAGGVRLPASAPHA